MPRWCSKPTARTLASVRRSSGATRVPSTSETTSEIRLTRTFSGARSHYGRSSPQPLCSDPQLGNDRFRELTGTRIDGHDNRIFFRVRLLERGKLALEQRGRHEMPMTQRHSACDQLPLPLEIHEAYLASAADQNAAVSAFERRARDNGMLARLLRAFDEFCNGAQPRPSVVISERLAGMHFFDVGGGGKTRGVPRAAGQ